MGTIIGALIAGTVLGILGRIILRGKQDIPWWATIGAGVVAALVGGAIADWLNVGETDGVDWIRHLIQIAVAVVAVAVTAALMKGRKSGKHKKS